MMAPRTSFSAARIVALAGLAAALTPGCAGDPPRGLALTPGGSGPEVVWDLDAVPLPEIPFPNDLATRADPTSPTGRRLNIPLRGAKTSREKQTRKHVNRLEGFSTFGVISVKFDAPLDLGNIITRHQDNQKPDDDAILLINVDPRSRRYGQLMPLDLGQGSFPEALPTLKMFWARDPRKSEQSLLFDTTDEDVNKNGKLEPSEDTDGDGHLDVPNVHPPGGDPLDDLVSFYERVTDTLLVRPLIPLDQETRYAVVLTKNLKGKRGAAVRSPWAYVNHAHQTEALEPLRKVLPWHGFSVDDVAYAWSFTTMGPTRDLEALRAGLYGHGSFSRLDKEYPPGMEMKLATDKGKNLYLIPTKIIYSLLETFGTLIKAGVLEITEDGKQAVLDSLNNVEYFVAGEVTGPNLLADRNNQAMKSYPGEADEVWDVNRRTGAAYYKSHKIPFLCAVPRADRGKAPFPVAIYAHGYSSTRLEMLAFAGNIARYGIATCSIDAVAHGLNLEDLDQLLKMGLTAFGLGPMYDAVYPGRARDVDNDGVYESGANFFSADLFSSRDSVRQTVLDYMVLIRALRSQDGKHVSKQDLDRDGKLELLGDYNGDGVVDIGGPKADYFAWGTSLGGIISSVVAGVDPAIVAATPQAVGGGLVDITRRSYQGAVVNSVLQRLLGPIFLGEPGKASVKIYTLATSGTVYEKLLLAEIPKLTPGDRIEIKNIESGATNTTFVQADGGFRVSVPADAMTATDKRVSFTLDPMKPDFVPHVLDATPWAGDRLRISVFSAGAGNTPRIIIDRFGADVTYQGVKYPVGRPLVALSWGYGLPRNSPDLRRMISLGQMIIDPADPINYAPHYQRDPLPCPYDTAKPGANVLLIATAGDRTVPVATAVALARAAGAVDFEKVDARFGKTPNQVLIDNYIIEGLARLKRHNNVEILVDPEDFSRGKHAPTAPRLAAPLRLQRSYAGGQVAIRIPLLNPKGQHGFLLPKPKAAFDNNTFMVHLVGRFLSSRGKDLVDDACMATASCAWIPKLAAPHK